MAVLKVSSLNCQGQSKLTLAKQLFIQNILQVKKYDILCLQETFMEDDVFKNCDFLMSNYNNFGTAVLVKNSFKIDDFKIDTDGRIIILNVGGLTIVNVYTKAGTDGDSRRSRDNMFSETLPNGWGSNTCRLNLLGWWIRRGTF